MTMKEVSANTDFLTWAPECSEDVCAFQARAHIPEGTTPDSEVLGYCTRFCTEGGCAPVMSDCAPLLLSEQVLAGLRAYEPDRYAALIAGKRVCRFPEEPRLLLSSSSFDLGKVAIGGASRAVITVENGGQSALVVHHISLSGDPAFRMDVGLDRGFTIGQVGSEVIQVTFSPVAAGVHRARVRLISSDPTQPETLVSLVGEAIGG